ncbi:MAG: hypothetical protein ACYDCL_11665 [Myxococcales bacterium]
MRPSLNALAATPSQGNMQGSHRHPFAALLVVALSSGCAAAVGAGFLIGRVAGAAIVAHDGSYLPVFTLHRFADAPRLAAKKPGQIAFYGVEPEDSQLVGYFDPDGLGYPRGLEGLAKSAAEAGCDAVSADVWVGRDGKHVIPCWIYRQARPPPASQGPGPQSAG